MIVRITILASLVLLAGCGPASDAKETFQIFVRQCKESTIRYDIGQEAGTHAMLVQCERERRT